MTENVKCPKCGEEFAPNIQGTEAMEKVDVDVVETECPKCKRKFIQPRKKG